MIIVLIRQYYHGIASQVTWQQITLLLIAIIVVAVILESGEGDSNDIRQHTRRR